MLKTKSQLSRKTINNRQMSTRRILEKLIPDHRLAYNKIIDRVDKNEDTFFFIDASGGTKKTYLTNLLFVKIRSFFFHFSHCIFSYFCLAPQW